MWQAFCLICYVKYCLYVHKHECYIAEMVTNTTVLLKEYSHPWLIYWTYIHIRDCYIAPMLTYRILIISMLYYRNVQIYYLYIVKLYDIFHNVRLRDLYFVNFYVILLQFRLHDLQIVKVYVISPKFSHTWLA